MQEVGLNLNVIALIILLGCFLGFFISLFLIVKSWKKNLPNTFMGFFILSISFVMLEGWLNYTGFIFHHLWLSNFAEPLNFIIAGLLYLFVVSQLGESKKANHWYHFLPFIFWLGYCMFYFLQPEAVKYNDSIEVMQLDLPSIKQNPTFSSDPWGLRNYVNLLTGIYFSIYILLGSRKLYIKAKSMGENILKTSHKTLRSMRNISFHIIVATIIFMLVKLIFKNDVGDYLIFLYLSYMILITTVQIMNQSTYFNEVSNFLEIPSLKYKKSSLAHEDKPIILEAIIHQMEEEKYFSSSRASLTDLAKLIHRSPHHVSQVINEKMNRSFFEMLASYRIEEAKEILKSDLGKNLTIEEIAERVGYNSKSAFNTSFKKITNTTPSLFRDS